MPEPGLKNRTSELAAAFVVKKGLASHKVTHQTRFARTGRLPSHPGSSHQGIAITEFHDRRFVTLGEPTDTPPARRMQLAQQEPRSVVRVTRVFAQDSRSGQEDSDQAGGAGARDAGDKPEQAGSGGRIGPPGGIKSEQASGGEDPFEGAKAELQKRIEESGLSNDTLGIMAQWAESYRASEVDAVVQDVPDLSEPNIVIFRELLRYYRGLAQTKGYLDVEDADIAGAEVLRIHLNEIINPPDEPEPLSPTPLTPGPHPQLVPFTDITGRTGNGEHRIVLSTQEVEVQLPAVLTRFNEVVRRRLFGQQVNMIEYASLQSAYRVLTESEEMEGVRASLLWNWLARNVHRLDYTPPQEGVRIIAYGFKEGEENVFSNFFGGTDFGITNDYTTLYHADRTDLDQYPQADVVAMRVPAMDPEAADRLIETGLSQVNDTGLLIISTSSDQANRWGGNIARVRGDFDTFLEVNPYAVPLQDPLLTDDRYIIVSKNKSLGE